MLDYIKTAYSLKNEGFYSIMIGNKKGKLMDNKKLKVYLDTSVISYLKQDDAPDKTKITNALWEKFKTGIYDIYLSQVTITEMNECPIDKLNILKARLEEIKYTKLVLNDDCFIYKAECQKLGDTVEITICGSRFLYNMVRTIVGTLLDIERHNLSSSKMKEILESHDRTQAGQTVNPYGLTLMKVEY